VVQSPLLSAQCRLRCVSVAHLHLIATAMSWCRRTAVAVLKSQHSSCLACSHPNSFCSCSSSCRGPLLLLLPKTEKKWISWWTNRISLCSTDPATLQPTACTDYDPRDWSDCMWNGGFETLGGQSSDRQRGMICHMEKRVGREGRVVFEWVVASEAKTHPPTLAHAHTAPASLHFLQAPKTLV
jgi:hypothetical protein